MRPADVSTSEILDAGRHLLDVGKKVSGFSLRQAVGNRGNPNRLMEVWQNETRTGSDATSSAEALPIVLPPGIAEMADQARAALTAQFDAILQTVYRTTDETLKARYKADFDRLGIERAQMADDLANASTAIEVTDTSLAASRADADDLRTRLTETEKAAAVTAERLRAVEAKAAADAIEAEKRIVDLEEQVRHFGATAVEAQKAQAAADATAAAVEREADRLRTQVAALIVAQDAAKEEAASSKAALAAATASLNAQRERAERAEARTAQA